jgi:hypothetical protein
VRTEEDQEGGKFSEKFLNRDQCSFLFKFCLHLEKKIFMFLLATAEKKGIGLPNRQRAANCSLHCSLLVLLTW